MTTLEDRVRRLEVQNEQLEARNAALERQARRWRRGGAAALAVVVAGLLLGLDRAGGTDLRGRRLVLVDGAGKERILLDADKASLVIKDGSGKVRVHLRNLKKSAGIEFMDGDGKERVGIGCSTEGEVVALYDGDGILRTSLSTGQLSFTDAKDKLRIRLHINDEGKAEVLLWDEEENLIRALR